MVKSLKKVLVGVLAASLMLSSVAFAADSPAKAPAKETVNTATVKTITAKNATLGTKVKAIGKQAVSADTKQIAVDAKSKKTVTFKKGSLTNAKALKSITVNKNKVKFEKGAISKAAAAKVTIKIRGLKKTDAAYKKLVASLKKLGFKKFKAV